jgi:hypothetical protein
MFKGRKARRAARKPKTPLPVRVGGLIVLAGATAAAMAIAGGSCSLERLLGEMVDFANLASMPRPFFKQAAATSASRESLKGGEAWFDNADVGQYVRTETTGGRTEQVLADLKGPGAVTRFWSANPTRPNITRFYFDGETEPRLELPLEDLFKGERPPFGPEISYVSGTGGNFYFPLPYARSLKITIEESEKPVRLYYEIGYRSYEPGTRVVTFDPKSASRWAAAQAATAGALLHPAPAPAPKGSQTITERLTVPPGETRALPEVRGQKAVFEWSARVLDTDESGAWTDPARAHNAWRSLLLDISFDGEPSIRTPLGDFFGSGPGVNPYENLFFTVDRSGLMTSRLLMPFRKSMALSLTNAGRVAYAVELAMQVGRSAFTARSGHLRAQWGTINRDSWPPFDTNVITAAGEGKVVGTVYEIANPVLVWWGEGDQKIYVDGETYPSTFGTGTEDDYGFAYGYNEPFTRPYHAQTRVDGPWSGGHISLNRWYVLDALPFRSAIRFDQEMWHWMPCRPTWRHVVYWYARPGGTGPAEIDRDALAPVDLGVRANMVDPMEGEALKHTQTGGAVHVERLANCSGAEHLVWRGAQAGERMTIHFLAPEDGRYAVELNLCQSPDYGRQKLFINGRGVAGTFDCYAPQLFWLHPRLGVFALRKGENTMTVVALPPNRKARPGNAFGLDYILLTRQ